MAPETRVPARRFYYILDEGTGHGRRRQETVGRVETQMGTATGILSMYFPPRSPAVLIAPDFPRAMIMTGMTHTHATPPMMSTLPTLDTLANAPRIQSVVLRLLGQVHLAVPARMGFALARRRWCNRSLVVRSEARGHTLGGVHGERVRLQCGTQNYVLASATLCKHIGL